MLQHNTVNQARTRAHWTHAALIGFHAACCGLPILALMAATLTGMTSGVAVFSRSADALHDFVHTYEVAILVASAALVSVGGALELLAWRAGPTRRMPWLFLVSVACFAANVLIVLAHRG